MADKEVFIPVLHVFHNQDVKFYKAKIREDKVYLEGDKIAEFSSKGVFTLTKNKLGKPKKTKMLIYLDGKSNTSQIQTGKEMKQHLIDSNAPIELEMKLPIGSTLNLDKLQTIPDNIETIFEPLTFKDRITIVKREVAKQLGKFKPMETWQFIVLIALIAVDLALNFFF